jgi:5-methyltetrahydrofolate--homocysteine methyltransferase
MRTSTTGRSLLVIGENLHATRVVKRDGKSATTAEDGRPALAFSDVDGASRVLPVPPAMVAEVEASGKIKHVRAAVLAALAGAAPGADAREVSEAAVARAYVEAMAARQLAAGADYLDLNVDEVADDTATQLAAVRWLVPTIAAVSPVAVALDSSSAELLAAGVAALPEGSPRPLLNSATLERTDVLDLAAAEGCEVVLSAAAGTDLPGTADAKVEAGSRVLEAALARGIAPGACHVDVLVLPVAVDPASGSSFLEAVRRLREIHGPGIHLTGGLSNVSFGLPSRKALNEVFIDLAVEAGCDSAIVDPVGTDLARALDPDRSTRLYALAADALTGRDPYCMTFLTAFRDGSLGA